MTYTQQAIDLATAILTDYRWGSNDRGENVHMVETMSEAEFKECVTEFLDALMDIVKDNN